MNKKLFLILLTLVSMATVACNSSKTDESGESDLSSIFVSDDGNTGSIEIRLDSNVVPVAGTANFQVTAKGADGQLVDNVRIVCDTENDLRIIEPSSGSFFTASFGSASGVIGCEDTGSFLFACGLGGAQRSMRDTVLIKCEGTRPIGFAGFPGSAGGGLGNGVTDVGNDEEEDEEGFTVRLTGVEFIELGGSTTSIDIQQGGDCDGDNTTNDPEPFGDASVRFTVSNSTEQIVRYTSYSYEVLDLNGSVTQRSPVLNLIGEAVGGGATGTFNGLFGFADNGQKFVPSGSQFSSGFKNIRFTLFGTLSDGSQQNITASQAGSFNNFDNC